MAIATRAILHFEPELHRALRLKAALAHRSALEIANEALKHSLSDEALLKDFKANGAI